jgi:coenzyme PQQ precursor peptide PqqA
MEWETPAFVEIDMSAEIGGYQGDDFENERPEEPEF